MLANSVWSTGIGQSVDESKAILCPCICASMCYQHEVKSLVVQAFSMHVVPVVKDVQMRVLSIPFQAVKLATCTSTHQCANTY